MTSFFPDLNVWLALSDTGHSHSPNAWQWLNQVPRNALLVFSRYTQVGLLRLLTNTAVMNEYTLTVRNAWHTYDRWLDDPRVQFHPDPRNFDAAFRQATEPFAAQRAAKWIGDCYLLAFAKESEATLVTFDKALASLARKLDCPVIIPAQT